MYTIDYKISTFDIDSLYNNAQILLVFAYHCSRRKYTGYNSAEYKYPVNQKNMLYFILTITFVFLGQF